MSTQLRYERYPFTPVLGWSLSRYELFDSCKRKYFYQYYAKYVQDLPRHKLEMLRSLTTVPLEIGNVVHDVIEAFLKRLQKSASDIDEQRFYSFARQKAQQYFSNKTFLETYYGYSQSIDLQSALQRIDTCLRNFTASPVYAWIFMKAITNRDNWMIEPEGYGETRLDGLKAYCKMDFLFPLDSGEIIIMDWKTGKKDVYKHRQQLIGYAAAASSNFGFPWKVFFPKIVYLAPQFDEYEIELSEQDFTDFFAQARDQTAQMQALCKDKEQNIPLARDHFPLSPNQRLCKYCNFQELCFPQGLHQQLDSF
jgi:CRISPR/Cas system-associated exonuclease Cas4 (RecB family)